MHARMHSTLCSGSSGSIARIHQYLSNRRPHSVCPPAFRDTKGSQDRSGTVQPAAQHAVGARPSAHKAEHLAVAAEHRIAEAEAALAKARGRVEMARALAALPAHAGDEDIVELSEPYDAALHDTQLPQAAEPTSLRPPSR